MFYQWYLSSYISLTYKFLNLKIDLVALGSGGSKGGARDAPPPPPGGQNSFIFMQFFGQKNRFAHPLGELAPRPPPPRGKSWIRHCVLLWTTSRLQIQQVCIPVGCVPPPSVATVNRMTNRYKNAGSNEVNLALEAMYIASALLQGS